MRALLHSVILALPVLGALVAPAAAHRLKLFATVDGATVSGYGFFIGGGRPEGVEIDVKDGSGAVVHHGRTDDQGAFSWVAPKAGDYTVTMNTGDGHFAETTIAADRFAGSASTAPSSASAPAPAPTPPPPSVDASDRPAATGRKPACVVLEPEELARFTEPAVDRAVARQLKPLIEAQVATEGRIRFNDVMGGVGMIVGLAGTAAWAASRRRRDTDDGEDRP